MFLKLRQRALARFAYQQRIHSLLLPAAVLLVALAAFGLRAYAVGWGLPYTDHPDEPSAANKALAMLRRGDWNPRFFEKPSLYYYLLREVFAAHLRYGFATGLYKDMAQIPVTTDRYLTMPGLFIWGRMLSVVLGAATVLALYLVGRRWWGWRVGLIAAALLAVSPFHMRESQYITVDVTTTLVTLLALAAALRLLDTSGWRDYALAGFIAGLAASAKYNAGAVALSVAVAHVFVWQRASLRQGGRLAWAALWCLLGFLAATPYAALAFDSFIFGIKRQYATYAPVAPGSVSHRWPVLAYLRFFWGDGLGALPFLAALAGIAVALLRRDRRAVVVLVFVPTQVIFFLAQNRHFDRNLLPVIPPLLLFAAIGVVAAAEGLARVFSRIRSRLDDRPPATDDRAIAHRPSPIAYRLSPIAHRPSSIVRERKALAEVLALALGLLVVAVPLQAAVALTRFEALPHSKVRAADFVRDQLPQGAPIAVALHPAQWAGQPLVTPLDDVAKHDAAWYRAQGYRYLVANAKDTDPQRYATLRAEAQVLAEFPGDREGWPGQHMDVIDLGDHPEALAIERRAADFGSRLALLGFQRGVGDLRGAFGPLPGAKDVPRGEALLINLYWRAAAPLRADYAIFLHLLDAQGRTVAQRDTVIRAADYPTSRWREGELAVDMADLPIPADLAPGEYRLKLGVYRMDTSERLPLAGSSDGALELMGVVVKS